MSFDAYLISSLLMLSMPALLSFFNPFAASFILFLVIGVDMGHGVIISILDYTAVGVPVAGVYSRRL